MKSKALARILEISKKTEIRIFLFVIVVLFLVDVVMSYCCDVISIAGILPHSSPLIYLILLTSVPFHA